MQEDGNLALYIALTDVVLWSLRTWATPVDRVVIQVDGNLACYDSAGRAFWATGTDVAGSYVVLQDDANLVMYSPGRAVLWSSRTHRRWEPLGYDTGDQHVDTGKWMRSWAQMSSTGLISGHTHIRCTRDLLGFHGSVLPLLLDTGGRVVWPPGQTQTLKHRIGVEGASKGTHDRTSTGRARWS